MTLRDTERHRGVTAGSAAPLATPAPHSYGERLRRHERMPQSRDSAVPADQAKRRVLLVEESPTVALFVRALLERWGCAVQVVDGQGAAPPDLSGLELAVIDTTCRNAGAIAAACSARAITVLAMSPDGAKLSDATAEIALPINVQEFQVSVMHCLDRSLVQSMAEAGIDADEIIVLWGGVDDPRYLRVVGVFIAEMETRMAQLSVLLSGQARTEIELQAHSIKGAAANVGATALHTVALKLEAVAHGASRDELAASVGELQAAAGLAVVRLRSLIETAQS
jgi:HPt (histidine-containing phosphotransfer) domain-containing protein